MNQEELRLAYWRIVFSIREHSEDSNRSIDDIMEELERDVGE